MRAVIAVDARMPRDPDNDRFWRFSDPPSSDESNNAAAGQRVLAHLAAEGPIRGNRFPNAGKLSFV
jgi:hypothetical protein